MDIASIINDYARNPINNYKMDDATVTYSEWNIVCDDSIDVFLKINDQWIIEKYSYIWELSIIWIAAASILAEEIEWKHIDEVSSWDYEFMRSLVGWDPTPKRKRAFVMPILGVRNAIHVYKNDWKKDEFEDLWEGC